MVDHGSGAGANRRLLAPPELEFAPGYVARRLYQAYVAMWTRAVDSALTSPQYAVLMAVRSTPGVDQGSLASSVALDRSTMADVARRLEDRGLITRTAPPTDGRRRFLHLTEEGEETLDTALGRSRELNEKLFEPYSPAERDELMRSLIGLADHWEETSGRL